VVGTTLPAVAGHCAGDIHVHCNQFGDDGHDSIAEQAVEARKRGLRWIVITAHAQRMRADDWAGLVAGCARATAREGVTVIPGLEVSTRREYARRPATFAYRAPAGAPLTSWVECGGGRYHHAPLGFSFPFYAAPRTSMCVSASGFLSFPPAASAIPSPTAPRGLIAPLWYHGEPAADVAAWVDRQVPGELRITWIRDTPRRQAFQARLVHTGDVYFYYQAVGRFGTPTVGVLDDRGEYGASYSGTLADGMGLKFYAGADSHYLALGPRAFLPNPDPERRTGPEIADAVRGCPHSGIGIVAHPFLQAYPWQYWTTGAGDAGATVCGVGGIELVSGGLATRAPRRSLLRWDALLRSDLPRTLGGGGFAVGVAGSDDHDVLNVSTLGNNVTWVQVPSPSPAPAAAAILAALRAGRCFASSDGSMTTFTAEVAGTRYPAGSVAAVAPGQPVALAGTAHSAHGHDIMGVTVIGDGAPLATLASRGGSWSCQTTVNGDGYFRVVLIAHDGAARHSYSNPIFFRT